MTCDPCYDSARLIYDILDPFNQLELEMIQSASGLRMYLNTFSRPLASPNVTVKAGGDLRCFPGTLFEGGQRLLLSEEARDFIIASLLAECAVEVVAGPYHAIIGTEKFSKTYFKLLSTASKY